MEKVIVHITELLNQTNQEIEFKVEDGYFRLRSLPPGKKRHVKLWKVLKAKHECPELKIRFIMNKEFSGVEINAIQLLYYARIIIKLEWVREGRYLPYLEVIPEKPIDYWLRLKYIGCPRDKYWDKRPFCRIWPDPTWAKNLRVVEAQSPLQLVVPVANPSLLQSCRSIEELPTEGESDASPPPKGPIPAAGLSSPERSRSIEELPTEGESDASPSPKGPGPAAGPSSPESAAAASSSSGMKRRENKAISLHINGEKRIASSIPAAAFQPEEHGPPKRGSIRRSPDRGGLVEELQRGSGGNMPELPQQKEEDDDLRSSIKCKDMEKTVQLMLLVIAFICVLLFKFLV